MTPARLIVLDEQVLADLTYWIRTEPRTAMRIVQLIEHASRDPLQGIGKPEPLKHRGADYWSRRITQEHRLVYLVRSDRVVFIQARYHY
ncbi:MAG: Txe/YoeB family addiction module toxin [Chloroflexi bacterium]|nr:MAG: Txe/YoeB family addiction module toxin [Chloroflexota bacterium]